ncbi:hypothetical protein D9M71_682180 [compost metagenome]
MPSNLRVYRRILIKFEANVDVLTINPGTNEIAAPNLIEASPTMAIKGDFYDFGYSRQASRWERIDKNLPRDNIVSAASSSGGVLDLTAITVDNITVTLTEDITSILTPVGMPGFRRNLTIRFLQDNVGGRQVNLTAFNYSTPPAFNLSPNSVNYVKAVNIDNLGWDGI